MPISKRYANLLSPITIGNNIIKNRMIYPNASPHVLQGPETFPAEGFRAFYANVAKNGAAIVTIAEWNDPTQHIGPAEMDMTHMQSFDMKDPSVHNYFSQLAEEIHFHGSKLLFVLCLMKRHTPHTHRYHSRPRCTRFACTYPRGYCLRWYAHSFRRSIPRCPDGPESRPVPSRSR